MAPLSATHTSPAQSDYPRSLARSFLRRLWYNREVSDEELFVREFRSHSFRFVLVATWTLAIVRTWIIAYQHVLGKDRNEPILQVLTSGALLYSMCAPATISCSALGIENGLLLRRAGTANRKAIAAKPVTKPKGADCKSPRRKLPAFCAMAITAALGALCYQLIFKAVVRNRQLAARLESNSLLIFFGISIIVQNVLSFAFSADPRSYAFLDTIVPVLGARVELNRLVVLAVGALATTGCVLTPTPTAIMLFGRSMKTCPLTGSSTSSWRPTDSTRQWNRGGWRPWDS